MEPSNECEFLKGFTFLRQLGAGSHGSVYLAERNTQTYAIKFTQATGHTDFEVAVHKALEAARRKYPHYMRNVVQFYGAAQCKLLLSDAVAPVPIPKLSARRPTPALFEIMSLGVYQTLTDVLQSRKFYTDLSELEQYRFFVCSMQQVMCQMLYLKKMFVKMDHNDLHYGNIMTAPHDEDLEYVLPMRGGRAFLTIPIEWTRHRLMKIGDFGRTQMRVETEQGTTLSIYDEGSPHGEVNLHKTDDIATMMGRWKLVVDRYCDNSENNPFVSKPKFIDSKEFWDALAAARLLPNHTGMMSHWSQFLMDQPFFANVVAPRPVGPENDDAVPRLPQFDVVVDQQEMYSTGNLQPVSAAIGQPRAAPQMLVCANCAASTPADSWRAAPYLIATRRDQPECKVVLCGSGRCRKSMIK
jgi:hypothetical protein